MSAGKVRLGSGTEQPAVIDRSAFARMFDDHAAHLHDYCLSLLGDESEAAAAARVTLIAAYKLGGRMTEPGRLRAWMFALGRRECLSASPTRREPWVAADRRQRARELNDGDGAPGSVAEAETREFARIEPAEPIRTGFEAEILRVVRLARPQPSRPSRPDDYHEALDLVQRHAIDPAQLPAILDIAAEEAQNLLAAAPGPIQPDSRDQPEPLVGLPAALWRDTASVVFDPEQAWLCDTIAADVGRLWADGFPADPAEVMPPSPKRMAVTSVGLAAALLAPAALGAGLYAAFAASPHSVTRSHANRHRAAARPAAALDRRIGFIRREPRKRRPDASEGTAVDHVDLPDRADVGAGDRDDPEAEAEADLAGTARHYVDPAGDKSGPPSGTPSPSPTSASPTPPRRPRARRRRPPARPRRLYRRARAPHRVRPRARPRRIRRW